MHGLAQFHHHIVGHVHHVVDGTDVHSPEQFLHPFRRFRHLDILHHPHGEPGAQVFALDFHLGTVGCAAGGFVPGGQLGQTQALSQHRGSFPGQAQHVEAVAAVGGQVDIQHHIIQPQQFLHVHPDGSVFRQDEDPVPLFRQQQFGIDAQFPGAAQHAVGIQAPHLGGLQGHAAGQMGAHHGHRYHIPRMHVLGPGEDLDQFPLPQVHLADPQMVRIGMPFDLGHLPGDDPFQAFAQMDHLFHFQAHPGQFVRQHFRRYGNIHILFQPINRS